MKKKELIDAFILLRLPFSLFLMPIFWYAHLLAQNPDDILNPKTLLAFFILHLLVYPSSNAFNSFHDKDENSIGGLEHPPKPNILLLRISNMLDISSILLAFLINEIFLTSIFTYILLSRAYSHPKIRIKKFPWFSLLIVAFCQGSLICFSISSIYIPVDQLFNLHHILFCIIPALFLASSYPLTQIYQHDEDQKRGDNTLSLMLGINRTFLFSQVFMALSTLSFITFFVFFRNDISTSLIFVISGMPTLFYFTRWMKDCKKNQTEANFSNTMRMNKISSLCTTASFVFSLMIKFLFFFGQTA
ncbi:MAG: UbiA family prenyltransferase [Cytophagales bacterium]